METLERLRERALLIVRASGAFVRVDHADALFVTDYPRRTGSIRDAVLQLEKAGFTVQTRGTLLYLFPRLNVPESLYTLAIAVIKRGRDAMQRPLRQALAVEMRKKNTDNIRTISNMMKGTYNYEN